MGPRLSKCRPKDWNGGWGEGGVNRPCDPRIHSLVCYLLLQ